MDQQLAHYGRRYLQSGEEDQHILMSVIMDHVL